jgi:hypothetical protein
LLLIAKKGFMSKGFTSTEALKKAYQAIDYSVMKQKSTVLSEAAHEKPITKDTDNFLG